jgi:hypothetical protein
MEERGEEMSYYLRIITNNISGNIAERMSVFLEEFCTIINATDYSIVHPIKPYYKVNGYGEMLIGFNTITPLEEIKKALGTGWDYDTIDSRRGTIYCDDITFLWLYDL